MNLGFIITIFTIMLTTTTVIIEYKPTNFRLMYFSILLGINIGTLLMYLVKGVQY